MSYYKESEFIDTTIILVNPSKKMGTYISVFFIFLFSCLTSCAQKKSDELNACIILKTKIDLDIINKNARQIITKGKDECIIKLLDKIYDSTKSKNYIKAFTALSAICNISDGYVSEYLTEISYKLVFYNFSNLFSYVYKPNSKLDSHLEKFIVEGLGIKIQDVEDCKTEKKKIFAYLNTQKQKLKMTTLQINYIDHLMQNVEKFIEEDQ